MTTTVSLRSRPRSAHVAGTDRDHVVAVDDACRGRRRRSCRSPSPSRAMPASAPARPRPRLAGAATCGRSAAGVDVAAVGRGVDRRDLGASAPRTRRRPKVGGGSVGGVDHEPQSLEVAALERRRRGESMYVGGALARVYSARRRRADRRATAERGLDLGLDGVGELGAARREQLDPVVLVAGCARPRPRRPWHRAAPPRRRPPAWVRCRAARHRRPRW